MNTTSIIRDVEGLYRIIVLRPLRRTKGVRFDMVTLSAIHSIDAIDRVIHDGGAISPGAVEGIERPWYMHTSQDDNLMVMNGTRYVELYTPEHGRVESFTVSSDSITHNGELVYSGAVMLVWPRFVFHRIVSDAATGSASINLATHYDGFNIKTNFSIYDLDTDNGAYHVIREGSLDQDEMV